MYIDRIRSAFATFMRRLKPALLPNSIYSRDYPAHQAAADLFGGEWTSRLPLPDIRTGNSELFSDRRPAWLNEHCAGLGGKRILELGPLEGGHTYLLEKLGADVVSIEANKLAFQRCLIAKNALQMRATFLLGDFTRYLASTTDRYDLVFASGVLYHMQDPVTVLTNAARVAEEIFLWTHYYDWDAIKTLPRVARTFAESKVSTAVIGATTVTYHERSYYSSLLTYLLPTFCGGMHLKTNWMSLGDLERTLAAVGFVVVASDKSETHPHGPCVSLYARRSPVSPAA